MLKKAIIVAFTHARLTIEALIVFALLITGWQYNVKTKELEATKAQAGQLADDLKHQITIKDGQIQILNRKQDGKVEVHTVYVPGEGTVTVVYSTAPAAGTTNANGGHLVDLGDGTQVYIKDRGLTFRPGFGFDYDGCKLRPYVDAKLAYIKRYSASVGGTTGGIGVTASRHLDDILFFHPQNVELFVHYRVIRLGQGNAVSVGLRSNF